MHVVTRLREHSGRYTKSGAGGRASLRFIFGVGFKGDSLIVSYMV